MAESRSELADLCREHGVAVELVESGQSLEQVLDRALQECEQQIAEEQAPTRGGLLRLQGLLRLASQARRNGDPSGAADGGFEKQEALFDELMLLCHKINNPLTTVLGRAQIMQLKLVGDAESQFVKPIRVIEESAKRVADLVQELANLLCLHRRVLVDRTTPDHDSSGSSDRS